MLPGSFLGGEQAKDGYSAAPSARDAGPSGASPQSGSATKGRKFYFMVAQTRRHSSGFELLNRDALFRDGPPIFVPPPGRRGFREYPEIPVFVFDQRRGRTALDFHEYHGYWFISDRMKAVLEHIDPDAFSFLKCEIRYPDGMSAPRRWLCDVVQVLDALDEERSQITAKITDNGTKSYNIFGVKNFVFRADIVGPRHFFRMMYFVAKIVCDEEAKGTCNTEKLTGIKFVSASTI